MLFKSIVMLRRAYAYSQQSQGILFRETSGWKDWLSRALNKAWDERAITVSVITMMNKVFRRDLRPGNGNIKYPSIC